MRARARGRRSRRLRTAPDAWGARPVFVYGFDDLTRAQLELVAALSLATEVVIAVNYADRDALKARRDAARPTRRARRRGARAAAPSGRLHRPRDPSPPRPRTVRAGRPARDDRRRDRAARVRRRARRGRGDRRRDRAPARRRRAGGLDRGRRPRRRPPRTRARAGAGPARDPGRGRSLRAAGAHRGRPLADRSLSRGRPGSTTPSTCSPTCAPIRRCDPRHRLARASHSPLEPGDDRRGDRDLAVAASPPGRGALRPDRARSDARAGGDRASAGRAPPPRGGARRGTHRGRRPLRPGRAARRGGGAELLDELAEIGGLPGCEPPDLAEAEEAIESARCRCGAARPRAACGSSIPTGCAPAALATSSAPGSRRASSRRRATRDPLLGDERRAALGIEALRRRDPLDEERYLFHACVSRPTERLYLSWQAADDDGAPAARSPFVDEVLDLLGPDPETASAELVATARARAGRRSRRHEAPTRHELDRATGARRPPGRGGAAGTAAGRRGARRARRPRPAQREHARALARVPVSLVRRPRADPTAARSRERRAASRLGRPRGAAAPLRRPARRRRDPPAGDVGRWQRALGELLDEARNRERDASRRPARRGRARTPAGPDRSLPRGGGRDGDQTAPASRPARGGLRLRRARAADALELGEVDAARPHRPHRRRPGRTRRARPRLQDQQGGAGRRPAGSARASSSSSSTSWPRASGSASTRSAASTPRSARARSARPRGMVIADDPRARRARTWSAATRATPRSSTPSSSAPARRPRRRRRDARAARSAATRSAAVPDLLHLPADLPARARGRARGRTATGRRLSGPRGPVRARRRPAPVTSEVPADRRAAGGDRAPATATSSARPAPAPARRGCWSSRYCDAVELDGVGIDAILAFTFTERAAAELRTRIRRELSARAAAARAQATTSSRPDFAAPRARPSAPG